MVNSTSLPLRQQRKLFRAFLGFRRYQIQNSVLINIKKGYVKKTKSVQFVRQVKGFFFEREKPLAVNFCVGFLGAVFEAHGLVGVARSSRSLLVHPLESLRVQAQMWPGPAGVQTG